MLDTNLPEKTKVRNIGGSETSLYSEIIYFFYRILFISKTTLICNLSCTEVLYDKGGTIKKAGCQLPGDNSDGLIKSHSPRSFHLTHAR